MNQNSTEKSELLKDIETYKTSGDESVYSSILEKYYAPLHDTLEKRRQANLKLLEDYPFCYAGSDALPAVLPLWQDEQEIFYALPQEKSIHQVQRWPLNPTSLKKGASVAIDSRLWTEDLEEYERRTVPDSVFMDAYTPFYLFYKFEEWALLLQLFDLKPLTDSKRVAFIIGTENIRQYFQGNGVVFPELVIGAVNPCEHLKLIHEIYKDKVQQFEEDIQEIKRYYSGNEAEINQRFAEGKPRILFITSRFTTALQYHTRDSMLAAQRLGCQTLLLIEPDGLHRVDNAWEARTVAEFKPDAVYILDHFRYERDPQIYPQEIVFITWIQDVMAHIMDPATPKKLLKRDFIMNHFITLKAFDSVGYPAERVVEAPITANPYIYHPYELTEEEQVKYGADICLVCHGADVDGSMEALTQQFEGKVKSMLIELHKDYHQLAYTKEVLYCTVEEFKSYTDRFFKKRYNISLQDSNLNVIADHMSKWFKDAVFRQVIVDWLIDAGFTNIKLWGNGWLKYEKYKPYAMGPAQNGEVLSKICQASKIVLGNNAGGTGAARAWESMLSGAFYMSNYVPPEVDVVDIRKIMNVGENLVMFYNKKDLIKKVRYYLEHDEERREMARRGREVALQKMTYDALMKRVIQFIGDKLSAASKEADEKAGKS